MFARNVKSLMAWLIIVLSVSVPALAQTAADDLGSLITQRAIGNPVPALGTDLIVTYRGQNGAASIGSVAALGAATGSMINITSPQFGASASAADNYTEIQAAANAAIAAGKSLYIPAGSSCYKHSLPITVSGNISIIGDWVAGNWNNNITMPAGTPALLGSVLCPASNGSDGIDIVGTSLTVNISNVGILFQTPFSGTGDGIHYVPSSTQGLSGSTWNNVMVYGHDGNHFAYNLQNFIYDNFIGIYSWGGGGLNLFGNGASGNTGNSTFVGFQSQVVVGGTAGGIIMGATALNNLALLTFINPQAQLVNQIGITPVGNPPTNAQPIFSMGTNENTIRIISPDFAFGNITGSFVTFNAGNQNSFDITGGKMPPTINSPNWGSLGIAYPSGQANIFNDTTGTGTIPIVAKNAVPGGAVTASNAVTYGHLATLYVPPVSAGTNVTATEIDAIYAQGGIFSTGSVSTQGGLFILGGNVSLLHNLTGTIAIGDGTANGGVTVGGASNKIRLVSPVTIGSATDLTLTQGEVGLVKVAASGSAPGAAGLKFSTVCGTAGGSAKIIAYAGTSTTPVTVADNIGSGVSGC